MPEYVRFGLQIHSGLVKDMEQFRGFLEEYFRAVLGPDYKDDVEVSIDEHTGTCKEYGCKRWDCNNE